MALPVHGSSVQGNGNTAALVLPAITVTGTNAGLTVEVAYKDNTGGLITSVVCDATGVNESLTQVGTEPNGGDANASKWQLGGATAKTAQVTITLSASKRIVGGASVYTGVDQTSPYRTAAVATATGTDASPTVDVIALNDEMVVDSMSQVSAGPDTATGDHTERHDDAATGGGTDTRGASQEKSSVGATETMGWTMSASDDWAIVAAPLQEPQGGTSPIDGSFTGTGTFTASIQAQGALAGRIDGESEFQATAPVNPLNVYGWEEGSIPLITDASAGTPNIQNTTANNGFAVELEGNATTPDSVDLKVIDDGGRLSSNEVHGIGFFVRFSSISALIGEFELCELVDTASNVFMSLSFDPSSSQIKIKNASGSEVGATVSPFSANTWHLVEIFIEQKISGTCEVYVDNPAHTVPSLPAIDTFDADFDWDIVRFNSHGRATDFVYVDDIYMSTNLTFGIDLYGTFRCSALYQDTVGGATDLGDTLENATLWSNTSAVPFSDATIATYLGGTGLDAKTGGLRMDGGANPGPSGDTDIDQDIWVLAKWIFRIKKTTGSEPVNKLWYRYGNSTDGMTDQEITDQITTSFTTFKRISARSGQIPTAFSDFFEAGIRKGDRGNDSISVSTIYGYLLTIPTPPSPINGIITGLGLFTATIQATGQLSGTINGVSTLSATGSLKALISGSIEGAATITGLIEGKGALVGSVEGATSFNGIIEGKTALSGTINGASAFSGTVNGVGQLIGAINGSSTFTGKIRIGPPFLYTINLTSGITTQIDLDSSVTDQIDLKSGITTQIDLDSELQ